MGKSRPINRSPFRRKPWAKKRPTRWNASTNGTTEDAIALNTAVFPAASTSPTGPIAVLCDGQVDVEPWADEQEVTLDRIVGSLMFYGHSYTPVEYSVVSLPHVIVKAGIVLNEELTDEMPAPIVQKDLFDQESFEDTEWLWLWSAVLSPSQVIWDTEARWTALYDTTVPIDIRNRRKIGQRDELAVYAQWASTMSGYTINIQSYTDARMILMSR